MLIVAADVVILHPWWTLLADILPCKQLPLYFVTNLASFNNNNTNFFNNTIRTHFKYVIIYTCQHIIEYCFIINLNSSNHIMIDISVSIFIYLKWIHIVLLYFFIFSYDGSCWNRKLIINTCSLVSKKTNPTLYKAEDVTYDLLRKIAV